MPAERAVGKCAENHLGSYGYPTRPEEPYPFCSQCGGAMVWLCGECQIGLPDDNVELLAARFCRHCGQAYFADEPGSEIVEEGGRTLRT
jgi:hypothetical protein